MAKLNIFQLYSLILIFYKINDNFLQATASDGYVLKSVNVIFRHGDRTPNQDVLSFYLTDPYRNFTYEPMGYGALTKAGELRMYRFGQWLRNRYNIFLGSTYASKDVSVRTTYMDRTKTSALLVLAALFPPNKDQKFSSDLPNWQPIPYEHGLKEVDPMISLYGCPTYVAELKKTQATNSFKSEASKFNGLMSSISQHIGKKINGMLSLVYLYYHLESQYSMNLTLPGWTKAYYPKGPLRDAVLFGIKTLYYNEELTKLSGGIIMRRVLDNMLAIVKDKQASHPNINLISGHDITVAGLLNLLNGWDGVMPQYSSSVIFELYEKGSDYFVKILHFKGIPAEYVVITIPDCSEYCRLENVILFLKNSIPDDIVEACYGPANNSLLIPNNTDPISWIYDKFRKWLA